MNRREFIAAATAVSAVGARGASVVGAAESAGPFKLNYAPGFRHFKHHAGPDPVDQIRFMHDQGFRALEGEQQLIEAYREVDDFAV